MLVYSRQLLVTGDPRETLPWVREITGHVRARTGLDVSVWTALAGAPIGAMAFIAVVESRAYLSAAMQPLAEDGDYLDIVNRGRKFFSSPPEDALLNIMHVAGGQPPPTDVGSVVSIYAAEVAAGKYAAAGAWAVEVAELVAAISGAPVSFCVNVTGKFGAVEWIQTAPDVATQESWDEQVNKDERYRAKLSEIGGMFLEGSGNRVIARRIV